MPERQIHWQTIGARQPGLVSPLFLGFVNETKDRQSMVNDNQKQTSTRALRLPLALAVDRRIVLLLVLVVDSS